MHQKTRQREQINSRVKTIETSYSSFPLSMVNGLYDLMFQIINTERF